MASVALLAALLTATAASASTPAGALDLTYGSCGVSRVVARVTESSLGWMGSSANAVAVQPDGRILLVAQVGLMRLRPDGSQDVSFGYRGVAFSPFTEDLFSERTLKLSGVAIQADGRIVVVANPDSFSAPAFVRYLPDGRLDPSFGRNGVVRLARTGRLYKLTFQPDGRIVAAGEGIVRLMPDGSLDQSFGSGGGVDVDDNGATDLVIRPDGKILFTHGVNGTQNQDFGVVQLRSDGSPDPTFGAGGQATFDVGHDGAHALTADRDGRIVVGGFTNQYGHGFVSFVRLLPDGRVDRTFGDGGRAHTPLDVASDVNAVAFEPDGSAVALVTFGGSYGSRPIGLLRFTPAGGLDRSFGNSGTSARVGPFMGAGRLARTPDGGFVVTAVESAFGGFVSVRFTGTPSLTPGTVTAANCRKEVSLSNAVLEFGAWALGTRSTPRTVVFRSTGTAVVRVDALDFIGDGRSQYGVVSDGCTGRSLAPGASCAVVVSYTPTSLEPSQYVQLVVWDTGNWGSHDGVVRGGGYRAGPIIGVGWNGAVGPGRVLDQGPWSELSLVGATSVSAGYYHTLAVKADGTVWTWGWNGFGQLGDGTTANRAAPVRVAGLANIASVSAGGYQSFAIGRDGSVWAWGLNSVGQLGDGTTVERRSPVRLASVPPVAAISSGFAHTLALAGDGSVLAWGWNGFGQLGDGTTTDRPLPTRVRALSDVRTVSAGVGHSLALTPTGYGRVLAWGLNNAGQVGDGTTENRHDPIAVPGLDHIEDISAGGYHSAAVKNWGLPKTWGWNAFGQLGDGTTIDRHRPVELATAPPVTVWTGRQIVAVAAGVFHTVALTAGDDVRGWGWNGLGQLGSGSTTWLSPDAGPNRSHPGAGVVTAGALHTLAL